MDTVYIFMICILFRLWKCDTLFWKKYTTVEIACPFIAIGNESVTWSFEQSTTISIGKVVNSKFNTKYRVTNTSNLQIVNFTYADEGRYTCQGVIGNKVRQDTVIVAVCNEPNEISSLSFVMVESNSEDIDYKQLTYTFGGITAVLIVLLVFAGMVIKAMALKINRISTTNDLPIPIQWKQSIEDEHKNDEDVVPHNVATTDSVNHHSVDLENCSGGRNGRSNPTLNENTSSYYQFDVSGNSNTESINEQKTESVNNTDNYFNNCFENDIYSAGDIYVNTNLMNTYEQLEEPPTTDIQTYEDFSYDD